jgi:hypothetical protein
MASATRSASCPGPSLCRCVSMLDERTRRTPEESRIKQKMIYASSRDALRRALVGVSTDIQATDMSEIAYDTVLDRVSKGTS